MKWCILVLIFSAMAESGGISIATQIGTQLASANDISSLVVVYKSYKGDHYKRRIALQHIDSIVQSNRSFYVDEALQNEIGTDLTSEESGLKYQAISTAGHLKIKALKSAIIGNFMNADKTDGGYSCGIRQAAMEAIEQIGDSDLGQVYLQMVTDRKDFWFNGDLLMALQGLARHADKTCIPTVTSLKGRFEMFLNDQKTDLKDYKPRVVGLLEITQSILQKAGKL